MSKIIWKKTLTPDLKTAPGEKTYEAYGEALKIKGYAFPQTDQELTALPDKRAYRSMSRSAVLLSALCLQAKETLRAYQEQDPFRVGLYTAIDNGPDDYQCARLCLDATEDDFAETYRKNRSPKQYLKQLPNLAPAQLGIFLDIRGPMNVYIHGKYGSIHALDQAEIDLQNGVVDAALVCASFSLEDPLLTQRVQVMMPDKFLAEGAAALVLVKNEEKINWSSLVEGGGPGEKKIYFGVADQLINFCLKE